MMIDREAVNRALVFATEAQKIELEELLAAYEAQQVAAEARKDFLAYVKTIWPDFIEGEHHRRIAGLFNKVLSGELKRLIISLPPRHTKSEFASYLLPSWYLGNKPKEKVIQVSNTAELAEGFGRKVRNLLDSEEYRKIFSDVELRTDSKAAGRWNTNHGGDYYATGVGAALAGRGSHLAILDDLHSEAEALSAISNPGVYDKATEWFTTGIRQRMQPGGAIVIVMTRWSNRDVIGNLLQKAQENPRADQWTYFEFPAVLPSGNPLWPEYWSIEELEAVKNSIPTAKWQAQYQQNPTADETAYIKRDWWKRWNKDAPPECEYTLMSYDTAFEAKTSADYSAMTLWGVFHNEEDNLQHIILLDAWRGKLEFPELKAKALEQYKEHEPDSVIIEKRATGAPLIYELRKMGIPAQEFIPTKGNDKIARLHAIADVFSSGRVWAPYTRWADEVIDEIASFPNGRNDDFVDSTSQAISRFRKGGMVKTVLDKEPTWEDEMMFKARRARYY
jgi:predicted phage terminase large subunit-like protein